MAEKEPCKLADGFGPGEKLWAQISFNVMGLAGLAGIGLVDWPWMIPYLVLYAYGIPGVVMRHLTCPRCPHLYLHGDCLQFPPAWTRRLVKKRKDTPFGPVEKALFWAIFILLPTYPLFWLWGQASLLAVFVLSSAAWYAGQIMYFCRRCRVRQCPFNRAGSKRT